MAEHLDGGEYLVDVTLDGGSGKASVTSPTEMHVSDTGEITMEIEWSSPNYDYMKVMDKEYYPVNDDGNSRFVLELDKVYDELSIQAETVAMSEPHMIDYTLHFGTPYAKQHTFSLGTGETIGVCVLAALLCAAVTLKLRGKHGKK